MRWLARWWPALAWAVVISLFSTGGFSSTHTSRIIIPYLHWLFPHASRAALLRIHHLVRKCGHFLEYFIFSVLILRGIRRGKRETHLRWALAAIALVALYATVDELHQSFVPGRGGLEMEDVAIDTAAGIAAQALAGLLLLRGNRGKHAEASKRNGPQNPGQ